ncbi:hypothetical protein HDU76_011963 [Blyttiomyces sp. JEL0837]|nr:hypothetical protein HDU76_011963 [Blyttiomyces sp. JEL0837]
MATTRITLANTNFKFHKRVVVGWPDVASGAGARILQSVHPKHVADACEGSWLGFVKTTLVKEDLNGRVIADTETVHDDDPLARGIKVLNVKNNAGTLFTLVTITNFIEAQRCHHLAFGLVTLFESFEVEEIILVGASNIREQSGLVCTASGNGSKEVVIIGAQKLKTSSALADRFMGSMISYLHSSEIPFQLIVVPAKRERRNGVPIKGAHNIDEAIPILINALSLHLDLDFVLESVLSAPFPPESFEEPPLQKKDDLLLMYM